jgi:hypothetical protein
MNEGVNSSENDELNLCKDIEYSIDEYNPMGNFRVYMPDKWWHSEVSQNPFSEKNLRIVKLSKIQKSAPNTLLYPGWDIKKGDYKVMVSDKDLLREFIKPDRDKFYILGLITAIMVVVLIVLYVSIILGNSIFSDMNIQ